MLQSGVGMASQGLLEGIWKVQGRAKVEKAGRDHFTQAWG